MSSPSLIGQVLGGKYQIIELLGRGGMATVYKGYQEEIDRYVAIKVLPPHPGQDTEFVERFRLEARTIARLQHPHILPVYDYGVHEGIIYLAIAYVEGGSLSDRIDSGPLPLATAAAYLREVASALDYAHRQNIIHRDIKPDNILINSEGYTLLADFGIAKLVGGDAKLTATGGLIGTPAYMAPEQAQGGDIGPAADIYSLGVVAFEMLTGRQPYTATTPLQVVMKHVTDPVPRVTEVAKDLPAGLENVLLRAMAKNPADRYPTASAFAEDFNRAAGGVNVPPPSITLTDTASVGEARTLQFTAERTPTNPAQTLAAPAAGSSASSTLLIVGGVAVIGLLVIAVVALVVFIATQNNRGSGIVANPTEAPTAQSTPIPATRAAAQPTPRAAAARNFGSVTFGSANQLGDMLTLQVNDLPPTSPGENYVVWLINTDSNDILNTGTLAVNAFGAGVLTYTDAEGRFLPGLYNRVTITREATVGETPAGPQAYSGGYPAAYAEALTAILSASADGINGSSLTQSAIAEAQLALQHARLAAGSSNIGGLLTHTEHTVNILLGTEKDYNNNGRGENPSLSKKGVVYFLDLIETHLDNALASPETTSRLESEAELIRVCVLNARYTVESIIPIENTVLAAQDLESVRAEVGESVRLMDVLLNGDDLDDSGQIDPFEGECSLMQLETFGVLAGVIDIEAVDA